MEYDCDAKHAAVDSGAGCDLKQKSEPDMKQCPFVHDAVLEEATATTSGAVSNALDANLPVSTRHQPVFIEACAGCGILSQSVKARGFRLLPIDLCTTDIATLQDF